MTRRPVAEPIAIVGIGCRFPGGIIDPASFWRVLRDGVDAIGDIPADRFDIEQFFDERPATPGKIMTRQGGFVGRLDEFDASFFGLSTTQAERLDPQQRLLLETTWEALEDAGFDMAALRSTSTGVFMGQWVSDFEHRLFADPQGIDFPMTLGSGRYAAAGRISYALGLRGPSLTVDAACSSGLAAVHLAVRSLRNGDGDVALAGGVNVILEPHIHLAYSQSRMMAPDGRCKFGDASADGYVRAEGAGIVVLKPMAKALADGDRIYAVIRGSAVNNDGDSSGSMGRPSAIGQQELLREALRDAAVPARNIGYVEAHGTGTRAGDPVELGALAAVLGNEPGHAERTWVGSVKTNFGHTEAAAGVAGLIKAALAVHHGEIPPSLHFRTPSPNIPWDTLPLAIPTTLTRWPDRGETRIAGVSSYGIGGTNAHVVLESVDRMRASSGERTSMSPLLLPLSARSDRALRALAGRYAEWLTARPELDAADVCWSAASRRTALEHRAAFSAPSREALVASLQAFAEGAAAVVEGVVHGNSRPKVAFVVPGQGSQWRGMAREMMAREPAFRSALEECDAAARRHVDWSIVEQLGLDVDTAGYLGDRIDVIQPVLVAVAIAYARWLRSLGVEPDAVVGHSMGEVGAAAIAGVLELDQAMRVICRRSALMRRASGRGAMAVVELPMVDVAARVAAREGKVSVAVSNSPRSTVISGDAAAVRDMQRELEREGVFCRLVNVDVASHSPQMDPFVSELVEDLRGLTPAAGTVPIYSTVLGERTSGSAFDAAYWGRNLRQPVRFTDAVQRMLDDEVSVFVELSPHPILTVAVQQTAESVQRRSAGIACGHRDESDLLRAYAALGGLWAAGVTLDWRRVMPNAGGWVDLPLYPWQREHYWLDSATPASAHGSVRRHAVLDKAVHGWLQVPSWDPVAPATDRTDRDRWLIVGSSASDALVSALRAGAERVTAVASIDRAVEWLESAQGEATRQLGIVFVVSADDEEPAFNAIRAVQLLQPLWARKGWQAAPRLFWVTRGAHMVRGDAPAAHGPAHAALWGAARSVATEHPDWWGGLVDLVARETTAGEAQSLARHLCAAAGEDQVAIRGADRFALRLVPAAADGMRPYAWRSDAAYLITGGLGGVGRHIAAAMVSQGARRLVLLGRTALPPRATWSTIAPASELGRRIAAVRELEHAGASVHVVQADVTDPAQVRSAIDTYHAEGWPPIRGVLHAAGVTDDRLTGDQDRASFERVMAPKLTAARFLDELFPELDVFVLFSSVMAFWGPAGGSNYAAANAGLDGLAQARRARGQHALSVQWGVWANLGLLEGADAMRRVEELVRSGVGAIQAEIGAPLLGFLLGRDEPVVAVMPIDWGVFRRARRGRDWPLVRRLLDGAGEDSAEPATGFGARIAGASPVARRALLETLVRETLGAVLRCPAHQLDSRRSFGSMGLDSLMALEVRNRLETALERALPATVALTYSTIEALVAYLEPQVGAANSGAPAAGPVVPNDSAGFSMLVGDLASLSDEDAARALRGAR